MMVGFIRYFDGYVRFRASGAMPERLLNLATRKGIPLWGMKRQEGMISACAPARLYPGLARLGKQAGVRVRLQKKHGLPFHVNRYRQRSGILAGALLFVVILYAMSFFLWNVEVSGQTTLTEEEITLKLYELNIRPGAYRGSLEPQELANMLMGDMPELSWAAVNITGSNAYVEVREVQKGADRIPVDQPCNIKAARDGLILSVEAPAGFPSVQVGEAVTAGDLLISGVWEDDQGNSMLIHSSGKVMAQTARTERLEYPVNQELYLAAGDPVTCRRIDLFGLLLPLSFTVPPGGDVSLDETETPVHIGKMHLPVTVFEEKWTPLVRHEKQLTETEALAAAQKREQELKSQWAEEGIKVIDVKCDKTRTAQSFVYVYTFTCEEDIAIEDELIVN